MAREVRRFPVTIPAGTASAAPITFGLTFPPRVVAEVEIVVPPGPRGEVGFQLAMSGFQVLPVETGQYFVTDDEVIHWPLEGQVDSGAWQVIAYNTGTYPHTLEFRFLVDLVSVATVATPAPISGADLSSPPAPAVEAPPPPIVEPPPALAEQSINMGAS